MDHDELGDALDGLMAYDTGAVDSGIHDESLRAQVRQELLAMTEAQFRQFVSVHVRERFLSDEALAQGYSIEDVRAFIEWLSSYMGIDV